VSTPILVNRVEIDLHPERIDHDFDCLKIITDLKGKQNFGKVVNTIYKSVRPLSLCKIDKTSYAALVRKGQTNDLNDEHFSLKKIYPGDLGKSSCAKLLIGALPSLMNENYQSSEGIGLYYLSDIEVIKGVDVIRTFEIKLEWEQKSDLVLQVVAATFTPIQYHTNANGELYGDCTHLPRVKFSRWSQELHRSSSGEFIKKKHRDKRMRSEALSLDTKNPSKFWKTKIGILALFMSDVDRHLKKYLEIRLQSLSPDYRVRFKDADISKSYQKISELLAGRPINIINLTDANVQPLVDELARENLTVTHTKSVDTCALNLAIHHQRELYESNQQIDPYNTLRRPGTPIIQSVYPETIIKDGKFVKTIYEACKKELLVKWEVADCEFKLVKPAGNWLFTICEQKEGSEPTFNVLRWYQERMSFKALNLPEAQDAFLLDLPRPLRDGDYAVVNLDTSDTFVFEDTNYVALPQYGELATVMNELINGYASGIRREWIIEFLTRLRSGEVQIGNRELVEERLDKLLLETRGKETLYKEDLFKGPGTKLAYKGSFQTFFDWIALEKGLRLGASLKAQESGFIEASLGLFYNETERLYFVGDKDNIKSVPKFCRIKRILTDANAVPTELLQMMEVFHIRHKQATIYPFPFKHLREFILANGVKTQ
jgi:hypothetical protein